MDSSRNYPMELPSHFEPYDHFIENTNFDHFVDLIHVETDDPITSFDYDLINGCFIDPNYNYGFNALPSFNGEEDDDEEDNSSTTTATSIETKKEKVDQSKTLISERRRRGRMKEKLYELRSLVPNITKMDKASIIGDAVLYVQDLQMKAKKLKAEIADLEASLSTERYQQGSIDNPLKIRVVRNNQQPICKKIFQLGVFQVKEKGFYSRLVCNKSEGVAVSLYKALESLTNFKVQNSNLVTESDRFALTFTLDVVRDCEQSMNLPNMKLRVSGALINQGFEFIKCM